MRYRALAMASLVLLWAGTLEASDPPITDSDYKVEQYHGPVIGSTRVIGLSGAYVSLAEEAVGIPWNTCSVANRTSYSEDWFDYDLTFDYLFVGVGQGERFDFDNNDRSLPTDLFVLNLGGLLQLGPFGLGSYLRGNFYTFADRAAVPRIYDGNLVTWQLSAGYSFWSYQLVFGGGFRLSVFDIQEKEDASNHYGSTTTGLELSGLYRPRQWPFRIGFHWSVPSSSSLDDEATSPPAGFHLPEGVSVPWEFRIGATYKFLGEKPLNPLPPFALGDAPEEKRASGASQEGAPCTAGAEEEGGGEVFLLVSLEFLFIGKVRDSVGPDGFFEQVEERSGRQVNLSPRVGLESEIWKRRLRVRTGFYWEPSRSDHYAGRLHWTASLQLRLFDFEFLGSHSLCVSTALDVSRRYSNLCLGIGFWH